MPEATRPMMRVLRSLLAAHVAAFALAACDGGERTGADGDTPSERPSTRDSIAGGSPAAPSAPVPSSAAPPAGAAASNVRPAIADSLRASLERLVRGTGGDTATWFSGHTADVLRSVEVDARGHAVVDFHDLRQVIPNASSSAGSEILLRQVNAAVFATPGVESVEYRMSGSCELLGEWLQYGVCLRFDRDAAS